MPLPTTPCDVLDDLCCTTLFDIAEHLLESVFAALGECYDVEGCNGLRHYVTMGVGDDGIADALTVDAGTITPLRPAGQTRAISMSRATFFVRLRESGFPIGHTENNVPVLPDPDAQMLATRHSMAHGEKMWQTLLLMAKSRQLTPSTIRSCWPNSVSGLTPLPPQGGVVGWTVTVTIDLPF